MNIAMISSWHVHAKGYAEEFSKIPGCKITAVWDESKEAGEQWAQELGCRFYECYDELLKDPDIDGVAVDAPTVSHTELIIKAAEAGKHIFTEKVMTITSEDADRVKEAVLRNKVQFVISFPHRCRADLLLARDMVKAGSLGRITYARVRNVHDGSSAGWLPPHFYDESQCGGGAMIDLGAHTIYLLQWLLGQPKAINSTFTKVLGQPVEDNAVSVLEFADGAIGVAETGFVAANCPFTVEICGTKGSLLVRNGLSYSDETTEGKWMDAEKYPEALPSPLVQFVDAVTKGTESGLGLEDAVALTTVMEAAYRSYRSGKKVEL